MASPVVFGILGSKRNYWGYEFDLSGSHDVIGHVTIGFPIGHFLLLVLWNQASLRFPRYSVANVSQWLAWF